MKQIRNKKGQYAKRPRSLKPLLFIPAVAVALTFGFFTADPTTASNMMSDEELCSLNSIECDPEWAPLEVYEVVEVPREVTAGEVALWYLDSINDLLRAKGEEEYLPILEEQQIYARSVIINEHSKK